MFAPESRSEKGGDEINGRIVSTGLVETTIPEMNDHKLYAIG